MQNQFDFSWFLSSSPSTSIFLENINPDIGTDSCSFLMASWRKIAEKSSISFFNYEAKVTVHLERCQAKKKRCSRFGWFLRTFLARGQGETSSETHKHRMKGQEFCRDFLQKDQKNPIEAYVCFCITCLSHDTKISCKQQLLPSQRFWRLMT